MGRRRPWLGAAVTLALLGVVAAGTRAAIGAPPAPSPPAAPTVPSPPPPRFGDRVAGIFATRCLGCHGADDPENGLRLDSYAAAMRGGQTGPSIVARDPEGSVLLLKVMRRDRPPMPPRTKLGAGDVAAIRAWIEAGALP